MNSVYWGNVEFKLVNHNVHGKQDIWDLMNEFFRTRFNEHGVALPEGEGDNWALLTEKEKSTLNIDF